MSTSTSASPGISPPPGLGHANRHQRPMKEPWTAMVGSFADLFVWLLLLKSFFIPLFVIPTGSMAETLSGAHATASCPNCGLEFPVGPSYLQTNLPPQIQCPNCRWVQNVATRGHAGAPLREKYGDRIIVHAWPYDLGGALGPRRWDAVVFKNPNQPEVNYIKRLIGLPGETIEVVDGDVFIGRGDADELHIIAKSRPAREALWMPYFDQDHPPSQPSNSDDHYLPRWVATDGTGWQDLSTRVFTHQGDAASVLLFSTTPEGAPRPAGIVDFYGYNSAQYQVGTALAERTGDRTTPVSDVRIGAAVERLAGDGALELRVTKYDTEFFARWSADGVIALEMSVGGAPRVRIGERRDLPMPSAGRARRLALGQADGVAAVELDGRVLLETTRDQFTVLRDAAMAHQNAPRPPRLRIAADGLQVRLAHIRVDRDVHYTDVNDPRAGQNGVAGRAISLGQAEYFVMGDNSPASQDSRYWSFDDLAAHLRPALLDHTYNLGTVPADQMIGRAFFVYWPGFMPLFPGGPTLLPDFGRVRWIH